MNTVLPIVSISEFASMAPRLQTIPVMLKLEKEQLPEMKDAFQGSDFSVAYIDLNTVKDAFDLNQKMAEFKNEVQDKRIVYFFDNFEQADSLRIQYLMSPVITGVKEGIYYKDKDLLLFNTYSHYKNIPPAIMNKCIHVTLH